MYPAESVATPRNRWRNFAGTIRYILGLQSRDSAANNTVTPLFVLVAGFAIGLLWMAVFRAAWRIFGNPDLMGDRMLPALALVSLEVLITGRGLLIALVRPTRGDVHTVTIPAALNLIVYILILWIVTAHMPIRTGWYPPGEYRRSWLNPLYPLSTYRPLILAPLWGRWAVLMAGCVGRTAPSADEVTRRLCSRIRPMSVLYWSFGPFILTGLYMVRDGILYESLLASLITFLIAYLFSMAQARRRGGQTRDSLLATAAISQLTFLIAFRALCVSHWLT